MFNPRYTATLNADLSSASAKDKLLKFVENRPSKYKTAPLEQLVIKRRPESIFERNSFIPQVTVEVSDTSSGSEIKFTFSLLNSVKWIYRIFVILLLSLELLLVFFAITNEAFNLLSLLIPAGFFAFLLALTHIGLYLTSKSVLEDFVQAITDQFENSPRLYRIK